MQSGDVRLFFLSISLIPLWWILGVDFIIYHIFSLYFIVKYPRMFLPDDARKLSLLMVVVLLGVGLVVSAVTMDYEAFRYIAAFNNMSVLFVGYCYYSLVVNILLSSSNNFFMLWRSVFPISIVYILLSIVLFYFVAGDSSASVVVPTFLGLVTPDAPGLLGQYQKAILVSSNWFMGEDHSRLFILAPYATGAAIVGCCAAFISLAYLHRRGLGLSGRVLFLLVMFVGVMLTLSRATIAGYILAMAVVSFSALSFRLLVLLLPMIPVFIVLIFPYFMGVLDAGLESRQGSTDTRMFSYMLSFKIVMEENILTGIGVKPRFEHMLIPVGSHSTFVGLFVRGGALALVFAIFFFILVPSYRCLQIYKARLTQSDVLSKEGIYIVACYICCALFLIFQDVDAYPTLCVLVLVTIATLESVARTLIKESAPALIRV